MKKKDLVEIKKDDATELISLALQKGTSVEIVERLMVIRTQLKQEKAQELYNEALAEFQSECPTIEKTQIVKDKKGEERYRYAPLDSIVSQVKTLLHKYGFSYTFNTVYEKEESAKRGGAQVVTCTAHHIGGWQSSASFRTPIEWESYMSDVQKQGSSLTFGKRYAFCQVFGIMTGEEDRDGTDGTIEGTKTPQIEAKPMTEQQKKEIEEIIEAMPKDLADDLTGKYLAFSEAQATQTIDWWGKVKDNPPVLSKPKEKGKEVPQKENTGETEPLTPEQMPMIENARKSRYLKFANQKDQDKINNAKTKVEGMVAIDLWYGETQNGVHIPGLREQIIKEHPEVEAKKPAKAKKVDPKSNEITLIYDKLVAKGVKCDKCQSLMVPEIVDGTLVPDSEEEGYYKMGCNCGKVKWIKPN